MAQGEEAARGGAVVSQGSDQEACPPRVLRLQDYRTILSARPRDAAWLGRADVAGRLLHVQCGGTGAGGHGQSQGDDAALRRAPPISRKPRAGTCARVQCCLTPGPPGLRNQGHLLLGSPMTFEITAQASTQQQGDARSAAKGQKRKR
jgi:hypothetical protein